jgi:hypothetical protein
VVVVSGAVLVSCSVLHSLDELKGSDSGPGADASLSGSAGAAGSAASTTGGAAGAAASGAVGGSGGGGGRGGSAGSALDPLAASWSVSFGREADQFVGGIVADSTDGIVLVGSFQGSTDLGAGKVQSKGLEDIFVLKLGPNGEYGWSQYYGASGDDFGRGVAVDPGDNVYVTGQFVGSVNFGGGALAATVRDIFFLKLDNEGNHVWSKHFGGSGSDTGSVVVANDQNVVFGVIFDGTTDFGGPSITSNGQNDIGIVKYDLAGNYVWQRNYGGTHYDNISDLELDAQGNLYFAGWFDESMTIGSKTLTAQGGSLDLYVAKLSADGDPLWADSFGTADDDYGPIQLEVTADHVIVLVTANGSVDFGGGPLALSDDVVLVRYDTSGNFVDATPFGDAAPQVGSALALWGNGLFIGGSYTSTMSFGEPQLPTAADHDIWWARLDGASVPIAGIGFNAPGYQRAQIATSDSQSRLWVAGQMEQTVDVGFGPMTSLGVRDVFVARIAAP